jgi:pilus assembly protein Flp/PilA
VKYRSLRSLARLFRRALRDEQGGEIMEYVLVGGLVIVGGIAVILGFGAKVVARWNSINNAPL